MECNFISVLNKKNTEVQEFRSSGVQEFRRIPLSISHSESDLTSACSRVSHLCL
jgi:hypothetical protein